MQGIKLNMMRKNKNARHEINMIPKEIKTNYFAPTKIHIYYKTIKIYNKEKSSKVINNQHNLQTQS